VLVLALAAALSTYVGTGRAAAQSGDRVAAEGSRAAAARAFTEGESAFARHEYVLALAAFRRALAADPHDVVRLNIAVCLERLARHREAIEEYTIAARSEQLEPPARAHASAEADRLRSALATLIVEHPAGAEVAVDGVVRCRVPCRQSVDPRPQTVAVRASGAEHSEPIDPERGGRITIFPTGLPTDGAATALSSPPPSTPPSTAPAPRPDEPRVLLGIGAAVAAAGVGCAIGFGVHAGGLHDRYLAMPSADLRSEGLAIQTVANASYAIIGVGAVLVLIDLLLPRAQDGGSAAAPRTDTLARLARGIEL
jgi:F0F1-type ATP synthase membrane subunit c/vacuolar-type H+-ATPase subunit K